MDRPVLYPFIRELADSERFRAFLEQLPVTSEDKERIAHGNAEQLFRF